MKKIIILLIMAFCTLTFTACSTVEREYVLKYNAVLYDSFSNFIDEKFQSENLISGVVYDELDVNDCPKNRTFIVSERENFENIFVDGFSEFEVDFDSEMLVVYTFPTEYLLPANITNMTLNNEILTIEYSIALIDGAGSAVKPFQRWFVVKLDKLNISSVVFVKK